ncbi:MFS general substrate transporter, partial [Aureobasidium melanogenum]
MPFLNPFKSYDLVDFEEVVVPLSDAPRHPSVLAANKRRNSIASSANDSTVNNQQTETAEKGAAGDGRRKDGWTVEALRAEIEADVAASGHDSAYDRKAKVVNKAIQDIGMGQYQWKLFVLCGFGWLADNLWLQGVALTLPSLSAEYGVSETNVRYTTLALFTGLCCGAAFWGTMSDIVGRRLAFNLTLFLTSVFGIAVGGTGTWIQACALFSALGCGVGGNLPVDGALFLEFLPFASGNMLTMLSVFWPFGQLLGSLIAWGFLPNFSCASDLPACSAVADGVACCTKSSNMGWRYLNYTMGCFTFFMFVCRFFLFHLFESPKFLLSRGRQREAVTVVHALAYNNKTKTWLTEDILNEIGGHHQETEAEKLTVLQIVKRQAEKFSTHRIKPLFAYKRLGINTALLWGMWAAIGMGYPLFNAFLPQYLTSVDPNAPPTPTSIVYRNYAITSIVGCPGSIIACYTVDIKYIGRKGTMAISTMLTGIFLFLFTTSTDSSFQLAFSCLVAFFQNIMYGVLYAYTPETFPAPNRGTGTGIASFFNRLAGLCAPIVAIHGSTADPKIPIYVSGALILASFIAMACLPIETRGKQAL